MITTISRSFKTALVLVAATGFLAACSTAGQDSLNSQEQIELERIDRDQITQSPISEISNETLTPPPVLGSGTQQELVNNIGDRVFFGYDRFDLDSDARALLDRQASWLLQYPNLSITVEGHADERGTREYNLALGDRRANSVQSYFVAYGIDPRRIRVISYGKERPAVAGSDSGSWAQNRRGVTIVE